MAMQYDVQCAHINYTGQSIVGRTRVKGLIVSGGASAGSTYLWDSTSAPISVTYARNSSGVITVTHNAHGFKVGDNVGLVFAAVGGDQGTTGNYRILTVATNTYTVQDINTSTVAAGTAALEAAAWITSVDIGVTVTIALPLPGEGIVAKNGVYVTITNLAGVTIFHG